MCTTPPIPTNERRIPPVLRSKQPQTKATAWPPSTAHSTGAGVIGRAIQRGRATVRKPNSWMTMKPKISSFGWVSMLPMIGPMARKAVSAASTKATRNGSMVVMPPPRGHSPVGRA